MEGTLAETIKNGRGGNIRLALVLAFMLATRLIDVFA